jgi:hypothetical protein
MSGYITGLNRSLIRNIARSSYLGSIATTGGAESIELDARKLIAWIVPFFPANIVLRVGITPGGDELLVDTPIAANTSDPITIGKCDLVSGNDAITIYFTGTVANGQIDIYSF